MAENHRELTPEEHHEIHIDLHRRFDELFADFVSHGDGGATSAILDLITWSHKQTIKPDHGTGM